MLRRLRAGDIGDDEADSIESVQIVSDANSAVARAMEGDGLVVEMNVFNTDSFFSDEERHVKAVLFTRKAGLC